MTFAGYWTNETSGELKPVVLKYLEGGELDPDEVVTMRSYLRQWIDGDGFTGVKDLRLSVESLSSTAEIRRWLADALEIGIDPL